MRREPIKDKLLLQQKILDMNPDRRHIIRSLAAGGLLLPGLLSEMLQAAPAETSNLPMSNPLAPKKTHFPPQVKRVIFMFMTGGVSHVDTFDPKPYLTKHHDEKRDGPRAPSSSTSARWRPTSTQLR